MSLEHGLQEWIAEVSLTNHSYDSKHWEQRNPVVLAPHQPYPIGLYDVSYGEALRLKSTTTHDDYIAYEHIDD